MDEVAKKGGKVLWTKDMGDGTEFRVVERYTAGMKGSQDKVQMVLVKGNKIIKDYGSHAALSYVRKWFEAKPLSQRKSIDDL